MTPDVFNDKPTSIFQMGVPPGRVDIIQGIAGVAFDEAWEKRVEAVLGGEVRGCYETRKWRIDAKERLISSPE
jgi:hypothetical protein